MKTLNVMQTRKLDLCTSCEICVAVCPKSAIRMENKFGQFFPKFRYIDWGRKCNFSRIKLSLFLSNVKQKLLNMKWSIGISIILAITFLKDLLLQVWIKNTRYADKIKKDNIIIIGGGFFNKGAQAMTFTVIDQIKRISQTKNIYLFSNQDFYRKDEKKRKYKFDISPWDFRTKIRLLVFSRPFLKRFIRQETPENYALQIIKDADCFIDISGYALSSQFGFLESRNYLMNIMIAKKFSVPYYIFPQSIGPFNYKLRYKIFLYPLMRFYLRYPTKLFVREEEGLKYVQKFTKKNVEKSYDIVLQNSRYNLPNIYNKMPVLKYLEIQPHSVGIIPNSKVVERSNPDKIYSIYSSLIDKLIYAQKIVYILRHSYEDLEICERIRSIYQDNMNVKLISDDLNAIELENIIKQFDFIIGSRYHSIIHSYKNGIPALVIGWAVKYFELLKDFEQLDYFFDVRNGLDKNIITNKLGKLICNFNYEKEKIKEKMNILNGQNIFKIFGEDKQ